LLNNRVDIQSERGTTAKLIIWSDSYNLGIQEIDEQHQMLISMINELHEQMQSGKGNEATGKILDKLISYTKYHFATEEKYFDQFVYPWASGHKKEHSDFTQKIMSFQGIFRQGKPYLSLSVLNYLSIWLRNHISDSDRKAGHYLITLGLN
jgi:hemerythrin